MTSIEKCDKKERRVIFLNRLFVISTIIIFLISLLWYYRPVLYFSNSYEWHADFWEKYRKIGKTEETLEYVNYILKRKNLSDVGIRNIQELKIRILDNLEKYPLIEEELEIVKAREKDDLSYYYWRMGLLRLKQEKLNESLGYFI